MADLERTVLYDLHVALGARMVPFAGYEMPVQYPMGVLKEHLHTRAAAGLFDVSHMGQGAITGDAVVLVFLADHEARDVLQEDQRDLALIAKLDEMGALAG